MLPTHWATDSNDVCYRPKARQKLLICNIQINWSSDWFRIFMGGKSLLPPRVPKREIAPSHSDTTTASVSDIKGLGADVNCALLTMESMNASCEDPDVTDVTVALHERLQTIGIKLPTSHQRK